MKKFRQICDYFVADDEELLLRHIIPKYFVDQNLNSGGIDSDYAARFLQNELNSLLHSFLNGGFSYKGYLLYPAVKDISKNNIRKIRSLEKVALFLQNNGHDFSNSITKFNKKIGNSNFAGILSALYRDLSKIKNKNLKLIKKLACEEFNLNDYVKNDLEYLKPLKEIKEYADKNLRQHLKGFYLHGSLATNDYIKGWSDVDTLSFVSKETISDPKLLLELRNKIYRMRYYFYKIDPLQHHGTIIISEYDIGNYCQAYFPVPVLKYARSFFEDDKIMGFSARDYSSEAMERLFYFVSYFRRLNEEKIFRLGSYDTKTLLHSITLFPSLYLQAKGTLVYKKFAFDIARRDFPETTWKIIDEVSSIRKKWKPSGKLHLSGLFSKQNPLLYYRLNSKVMDIFNNSNKINSEKIIKNMLSLSEEAWGKIKKNAKRKL